MTAEPFFTADENARRTLRQVDTPLLLEGDVRDVDLVIGPNFVPSPINAALYIGAASGTALRNVRVMTTFQTYDPAWAADPQWATLVGVRVDGTAGFVVNGLHVEGFPHCGLQAYGLKGARIRRVSGTRCFWPYALSNPEGGSDDVLVQGLRAWDTWGPETGSSPSRLRPGGWIGDGGFVGEHLRDATLLDLDVSGELGGGVKLSHCQRVLMDGVKTNRLMIQGTEGRDANVDGSTDGSFAITVRHLIVDKRRGEGRVSDESNGVQVSWHVSGLVVESFSILAGGSNGDAIQLSGGCEASFRGGVISGFNKLAGTAPAYAAEVLDGSTLNADFETANQFYDQVRLVRVG